MSIKNLTKLLILLFFLIGCSVSKHLKEDQLLITKTRVTYKKEKESRNEQTFKAKLIEVIKPQASDDLFKFPIKIHQWGEKAKKEKSLRKWMQRNLGQAPALYNEQEQSTNKLRIKKLLKDNGFFRSDVQIDTIVKGKEVELNYIILTSGQYKVNEIFMPSDSTEIGRLIAENQAKSLVKKGAYYSEVLLTEERLRLDNVATKYGYLDFNDRYIYYFVDSIPNTLTTDIYFRVQTSESGQEQRRYKIGKTSIYPNYDLSNTDLKTKKDTLIYKDDIKIIEDYHLMDHKVLDRMVLQSEGEIVRKDLQDASVSHLLDLGIFKFVNLKYERQGDSLNPILNRSYYLTPDYNQNFSANFELNNRTGGFYGIGASTKYQHKNIFKKAVTFSTTLSGGVETQIGNNLSFINTLDFNIETSLAAPRFIIPFKLKPSSGLYVPRTSLSIGNNFQRRVSLYSLNSTNLKFGYQWKETSKKQHSLYPVSINRVEVLEKSMAFDSLLNVTPRLLSSFQNSFIVGLDYTYIFSNQSAENIKDYWFFKGNLRTSGNLLQVTAKAFDFPKNMNDQYSLFRSPFAQFTSIETDLRYYQKFNNSTLAYRFYPAIGFAYGNSEVLPYIEQFIVGGANSIRAFQLRDLGPGSFATQFEPEEGVEQQFIDQTGDIKLEMNAEYRFPILGFIKGAAFVDAGNIWLLKDDVSLGQKFDVNTFWKEIAIGLGLGIRIDIEYIVLRLDVAMPIRKAYYGEGFKWSFDKFEFGDRNWRNENIIYNLAVGYPF